MIEVKNLTKRYGSHLAIDALNFTVLDGEILGFLGPNGAGKTTTMNIMTGYLSPTEGSVVINGLDIVDEPVKAKMNIGYLPDTPPLYPNMFITEYLDFVCDIKKVKKSGRKDHLDTIMEAVKIEDVKKRLIKNLSKGYRQRVGLAQAMVGSPDVIILDEPTAGLDPKQIIEMRDVIRELGKKHTVILSSHILSEVSAVCSRIIILYKGKIVASDTPERLSASITGSNKVIIRAKGESGVVLGVFKACNDIEEASPMPQKEEGTCDFTLSGSEGVDIREAAYKLMTANNITLLMMKPYDLSLEETFLQITSAASAEMEDAAEDETEDETKDETKDETAEQEEMKKEAEDLGSNN